ncbi:AAA domain-containing protein [Clostridium chromiireducens]|uniref:AAA domain-containing protein n=1 Tax=Clostridium chromiireducens TaxID=225345 RepID=A0A964W4N1_9CLOT|nr:AAA family ATPase [Clostridium chromiireducens]MVX66472.1 AAA domain-containing protein [Clostridium chromiireducens]
MRWSLDVHKYISEITRKALQIIVAHGITSQSSDEDIDVVEHELASANIYKNYEGAKGRVRRALFTYFKAYGCLNDSEQLTEVGKAFSDNELSIREFCFYFIVNYKFIDNEISYYPVEFILKFLKAVGSGSFEDAYLTPYDFSRLVECNSIDEINDEFVSALLNARENASIDVEERKIGYDVWSKMLINAGILEKNPDKTLRAKNANLVEWMLSAYEKNNDSVKGKMVTGIICDLPVLPYGQCRSWDKYTEEGATLQAFLFEGVEVSIIERYIRKTQDISFATLLSDIGLTSDACSFYKDFIGLEKLVAYRLRNHEAGSCQVIGDLLLKSDIVTPTVQDEEYLMGGSNTIFYGAPGTGKSHSLEEKSKEFNSVERVTFYPEYTHDDFIGCFMPCMSYVKNDVAEYIAADGTSVKLPGKPVPYYTYVPGPFTNALVDAFNNPGKNILLIVEELNRANAAAVFGEFFQLLDRCEKNNKEGRKEGESKYSISVSNEYSEYLSSKIETYSKGEKVTIPSNFTICATMNSADQGVNPLDSAFKRRWNFIYVPIDFSNAEHKDYEIEYGKAKVTWETFATTINKQLKKKDINEDKHLGQYFITETEIADLYKFASKILLYLFDDVLKFNRRGFFKSDYKTFSDLLEGFINGEKIFEFEFSSVISRETERETTSEVALDAQKVTEGLEVNYAEQPKNDDMPRVAEDGSNGFQYKVL